MNNHPEKLSNTSGQEAQNKHTTKLLNIRTLCVLAMMSALAFLLAAFVRFPFVSAVPFLRYDPKDIVIVIAGFIFGPLAAFIVTVVVSLMQYATTSFTGHIGLFMNIVSSTAFCCTAALIYKKKRTFSGAVLGLIIAGIFATAVMMMWNYIISPHFMNITREQIVRLLIPGFLPFNLVSNGLNIIFSLLLYKRVKGVLKGMRMMPQLDEAGDSKISVYSIIFAVLFLVLTCVLWVLLILGVI